MNRAHLARLLERDSEAYVACRRAVLDGATIWISETGQQASTLAHIYARRQRTTRQFGIPTLGFPAAVQELHDRGEQLVRLAAVDVEDPPYHFQLFLNDDVSAVLACIGVDGRTGYRVRPGDQVLLECQVISWESNDFPGWIRASITDAAGRTWSLVEKAPVLGIDLKLHAPLPTTISIRGTVVRELPEDDLDTPAALIVSTAVNGISAEDGTDQFIVTRESVRRLAT
ncbi:hypothetical protein AB0C42_01855 [Micromonospora taraxaci]|uniref:hypothetical protein n=1 Tax=Micromonospora taraxaci TaxID=1316803 RepID=UPI0034040AD2